VSRGGRRASAICWLAAVSVAALALAGAASRAEVGWRAQLQRAEAALASGDARAAEESWWDGYRTAMRTREQAGLLDLGHAYLRIGEAAHDRQAALGQARRVFLRAFFQAREQRDAEAMVAAGEAFASIGDHPVAVRALEAALTLAHRSRDAVASDRIAALRARSDYATRAP
jgi:tetratricopeptide (TPR) repeat protein